MTPDLNMTTMMISATAAAEEHLPDSKPCCSRGRRPRSTTSAAASLVWEDAEEERCQKMYRPVEPSAAYYMFVLSCHSGVFTWSCSGDGRMLAGKKDSHLQARYSLHGWPSSSGPFILLNLPCWYGNLGNIQQYGIHIRGFAAHHDLRDTAHTQSYRKIQNSTCSHDRTLVIKRSNIWLHVC